MCMCLLGSVSSHRHAFSHVSVKFSYASVKFLFISLYILLRSEYSAAISGAIVLFTATEKE